MSQMSFQAYKGVLSCYIGMTELKTRDIKVLSNLEFTESCWFRVSLEVNIPKLRFQAYSGVHSGFMSYAMLIYRYIWAERLVNHAIPVN